MCLTFQMMTLEKYLTKNFEIFFRGYPLFGPSKCGVSQNVRPSTAYDPTFLLKNLQDSVIFKVKGLFRHNMRTLLIISCTYNHIIKRFVSGHNWKLINMWTFKTLSKGKQKNCAIFCSKFILIPNIKALWGKIPIIG